MVSLKQVKESNARIKSTLPSGLVAVFLGGTSGIGEFALIEFARYADAPRAYFVGRSQEAADRITKECQRLNPQGQFTFIKADTSLMKNIDTVCEQIKAKESAINILFLTQGTLLSGVQTSEDIHLPAALLHYGRARFTLNLLPLVQRATALKRVVSVAIGTKEGEIDLSDPERKNAPLIKARAHGATMHTLSLSKQAELAPDVSFVHEFPGWVRGGAARDNEGFIWTVAKIVTPILAPFFMLKDQESGERSLFAATSAIFPAATAIKSEGGASADGVPLAAGVSAVRGIDGKIGSGLYSVDYDTTPASPKVEQLLARYKREGADQQVWDNMEKTFLRTTGKMSI